MATDRDTAVDRLIDAGWDRQPTAPGMPAQLAYSTQDINLEVSLEDEFYLSLLAPDGAGVDLVIEPGDCLVDLVEAVTDSQDSLTPDNFRQLVGRLIDIGFEVRSEVDGEFVKLERD